MVDIVSKYRSVSFIGMSKNAGKTTTLNFFIEKTRGVKTLGLSSIGRDGESLDRVTGTEKPQIYVYKGTLVATASACLKLSDATLEILEVSDFTTPMGKIVIARAISDGFVEIAGPSTNSQTKKIMDKMCEFGAEQVFIDGAISRKSLASPTVAEATIMSTGASFSKSIDSIVQETIHSYNLLITKKFDDEEMLHKIIGQNQCTVIADFEGKMTFHCENTIIGHEKTIAEQINDDTRVIYTRGAITDSFIDTLLRNTRLKTRLSIIVHDGTKLFLNKENLARINKRGWKLNVAHPINLAAITVNPFSANDYCLDSDLIIRELKKIIRIPIFDVKKEVSLSEVFK